MGNSHIWLYPVPLQGLITQIYSSLLIHIYYPPIQLQDLIYYHILFQTLYFPPKTDHQFHLQKNYLRHKLCYLLTPKFESILNYNYIFRALQHILPSNIIQNSEIYITVTLPHLPIYY